MMRNPGLNSVIPSCLLLSVLLIIFIPQSGRAQVEVWTARYDGGADDWDEATSMVLTPDGNIVVTGFSVGSDNSRDIATVKFSGTDGEIIWSQRWAKSTGSRDEGWKVCSDTAGNIFVAGWTRTTGADTDFVVIKYSADGEEQWVYVYDSAGGPDRATGVVADEAGGCYAAGYSSNGTNRDYVIFHFRPDGSRDWFVRYNGPANGNDLANAVARDKAGNIYVTGFSWGGSAARLDYLTMKISPAGETIWTRRYDGTAVDSMIKNDFGFALAVDDSDYVYVTGRAGESGSWYDGTTIKYTPSGQVVWINRFDWGENALDGTGEIRIGPDRGVYCAGYTETNIGWFDMVIYKLAPDGQLEWQRSYDYVADDDSVTGLWVDRFGNAYLTGYSYGGDGCMDWVTMKYNPNGALIWMARHSTFDEDDQSYDIAVNGLGDVLVAGYDYLEGSEDYAVVKYSAPDVGAALIIQPVDTFRLDAVVTPRVRVKNFSALSFTFPVRIEIGNFYFDIQQVPALAPYDSADVTFAPWLVRDLGEHAVVCYSMLNGDKEPGNDTVLGRVITVSAWERLEDMPAGARGKGVKDGGALSFAQDSLVFGFKGNNTTEFYAYNTRSGRWVIKESIPAVGRSGSRKRVKGGACLAADTAGSLFALKGSNTLEFWRYSIADNRWTQLPDFPTGGTTKRVKNGSGMVYVPQLHRIYALRGANTNDFYCYVIARDSWMVRRSVPPGERNRRMKDGSAIAFDGDSLIYALKGGTYEFYAYNIRRDTWIQLPYIPDSRIHTKRTKMKKGAAMAYDYQFQRVYATKGGKSTEFWFFDAIGDSWSETRDTFPRGPDNKAPSNGGALTYGAGKVYALKGNKTREFWRYNANFPLNPPLPSVQAEVSSLLPRLRMTVMPNPVRGHGLIRYTLPQSGAVRLAVYDIAGRAVRMVKRDYLPAGEQTERLETAGLSAGVYLVRIEVLEGSGRYGATQKVLITR